MKYIEGRKIVDEILSGKREEKGTGEMEVLISILENKLKHAEEKADSRDKRLDRLSKIKVPDVILMDEHRFLGRCQGEVNAYKDCIDLMKCISAVDSCPWDVYKTIRCSKNAGCKDCLYRVFKHNKEGKEYSDNFYCALHVGLTQDEKDMIKNGFTICDEDGNPVREATEEEIKKELESERWVMNDCNYNTPCEYYRPSESPIFLNYRKNKGMDSVRQMICDNDIKYPEYMDEDYVCAEILMCHYNANNIVARQKLLKSILGDKKDESERDS